MDTFLGSLVQSCCGEGGTLQTDNTAVCLLCPCHTGFAPAHGMCPSLLTLLRLVCWELRPALGCMHFPGLNRSGSDTGVLHKVQTRLGLHFVPFPGPSSSGDHVFGEHGHRDL